MPKEGRQLGSAFTGRTGSDGYKVIRFFHFSPG
jgi:hypothetical protein